MKDLKDIEEYERKREELKKAEYEFKESLKDTFIYRLLEITVKKLNSMSLKISK